MVFLLLKKLKLLLKFDKRLIGIYLPRINNKYQKIRVKEAKGIGQYYFKIKLSDEYPTKEYILTEEFHSFLENASELDNKFGQLKSIVENNYDKNTILFIESQLNEIQPVINELQRALSNKIPLNDTAIANSVEIILHKINYILREYKNVTLGKLKEENLIALELIRLRKELEDNYKN